MSRSPYSTRQIFLVLFVFFSAFYSYGQHHAAGGAGQSDIAFEIFELPGGSTGNAVTAIIQDSLGYMWFGSQAGLHRYDGKNFITYNSDPINQNTLNSDYIEDIYLDKSGMLWLTHWSGGGLTAYNPEQDTFTRYVNDVNDPESILIGETSSIIADSEGDIWVGGRFGVSRLNKETGKFRRYSHDSTDSRSLSDNEVRGLYLDTEGTIWVATGMPWTPDNNGGLNRYDPDTDSFERFMHDPGDSTTLSNNKVRAMFEDSKGNFWVGTARDGLHLFDRANKTFTRYAFNPEAPDALSMPFLKGTDLSSAAPWNHIASIMEDHNGRLWISAVGGGLNIYDPNLNTARHFEASEGENQLTSNFIWQTFQSDDGTVWISTAGEGYAVYKVKENRFKFPYFETQELIDSVRVQRGIIKDSNGSIWIAQSAPNPNSPERLTSRLWRIDRESGDIEAVKFKQDESSRELSAFIGSISLDSSGNIWAGTTDGYFIGSLTGNSFREFIPEDDEPESWWLAPIIQSSTGHIWIPYWGHGVIRYDPVKEEYELFEHDPADPNSPSGPNVWSIYEAPDGALWMGGGSPTPSNTTPLFLDRFDPKTNTFEPFISESLPFGMVSDITASSTGNLWFIDWNYGLYKLNPVTREVKRFNATNSLLPGSRLESIVQYPGGDIWIGTDSELIAFDPIQETFSIYDEHHGIRKALGNTMSGYLTEDGELLFARWDGYHAFKPNDLLGNVKKKLPDLRITGFKLMDDKMISGLAHRPEDLLQEPIWKTELIELGNNENTFAFAVACFDFYEPESNMLQFMLEGYDRGWRGDLRNGETPFYINVPPGEYTFRLRGVNGLGAWNTDGVKLQIRVNPPWWQTPWAFTLYAIIFFAGVFGVHKIQKRRLLLQERKRTQERELRQAREIEKAYNQLKEAQQQLIQSEKMASLGELTAGIAHEIQNPLNFVNNFSEVNSELIREMKEALDKGNLEEIHSLADDIDENEKKIIFHGKRADSIVKGMLQHSRSSDGKKVSTDLNTLVDEYVRLAYHGLRAKDKSFNAKIKSELDPNVGKISVVPQDIGRVILNLLTNAFYAVDLKKKENPDSYSPEVFVRTSKKEKGIDIEVGDNGNGIPGEALEKIFQPFYTTKPTGQGTGLGLSMSYDIITTGHGGEIKVTSKEGQGTTFRIFLPVK